MKCAERKLKVSTQKMAIIITYELRRPYNK